MPDTSRPARVIRLAGSALLLAVPWVLGGCADDMEAIDRRIEKVVGDRAARLGGGALAPARAIGDGPTSTDQRRQDVGKDPETVNPDATELTFSPADEARDVKARLQRQADRAAGRAAPGDPAPAAELMLLGLEDAFRIVQRSGRDFLTAEEEYILAAIRLLQERHLWGPRLFNDTSVSLDGQGDDGRFEHTLGILNQLRVNQRLPYGGSAEAAWVWDATEQLRRQATSRYEQASSLVFRGNIPLLRGAGLIAQEDLIQAERNLVYQSRTFERFRRSTLVDVAQAYFDLIELRSRIANQERQLEGFLRLRESTSARVTAGRLSEFQTAIAANQVLRAEASLASQREQYILALDRFKIRLGLDIDRPIDVKPLAFEVPEPDVDADDAATLALALRLDLQNERDRLGDARRAVANAKNQLLPDLDLDGSVTIPTDADAREGGVAFDPDDTRYSTGVTMSLPLDRNNEKLGVRAAQIREGQQQRRVDRLRDDIVVDVRRAARQIDLQRFQLTLAEQQVEINRRRLEEQELKEDRVDPQTIVDTRNDLLESENDRDRARTNLRNAVLDYLLTTDQLRVARDGAFERLGPSDAPPITAPNRTDDPGPAGAPTSPTPVPPADAQPAEVPPAGEAPQGVGASKM